MTFLEDILELKKARVADQRSRINIEVLKRCALEIRAATEPHRFRKSLERADSVNIIAEIKRASPSKGVIDERTDVVSTAISYEKGGASAISVLTEEDRFNGSLDDLKAIHAAVSLPILRKDFIFDEFQIYEAAEAGADAVLLIAAMLDDELLDELHTLAVDTLGLDVLVEVHTIAELERVNKRGFPLVGVNNRCLRTFNVTLDVSRELIRHKYKNTLMIAESGIALKKEITEMRGLGFDGFLIGETLMRSSNPEEELMKLTRK